jgi:hypothetical protein
VTEKDRATLVEASLPAPPPGPALLGALADLAPVRARVPRRALAAILAVGIVYPASVLVLNGPRRDLPFLPVAWVATMALLWAAGVLLPLGSAVLPRRGEVLPSAARAGGAALAAAVVLLAAGLFATMDAPGKTVVPASSSRAILHCLKFGVAVTAPVLLVGAFALRSLHPIGAARVAAAVGAAGGALGGLTLHFLCPLGGGLHVGLAHAGSVVVGALAGALLVGRFVRA